MVVKSVKLSIFAMPLDASLAGRHDLKKIMTMDYLASHLWQLWALLAVACLVGELCTGGFYILCFALGAVVAAVFAPVFALPLQLAVFAVASVACIFTVRPLAQKYFHRGGDNRPSNTDALLGRTAMVSEPIEAGGYGRVSIDGDDWKAECPSGQAFEKGAKVKVTGRESVILKVEAA